MPLKCELCTSATDSVETLWFSELCRVVLVTDPDYPGFCRVILNSHVLEMTDLPVSSRTKLMDVVFAVESAIRNVVRPDKINVASLGNRTPHLHWHVIPRWRTDRHFPNSVWSEPARAKSEVAAPTDLRQRLMTAIADQLATSHNATTSERLRGC
ncbi:MAG: HIT family protein [Planctomycetota bacterium]